MIQPINNSSGALNSPLNGVKPSNSMELQLKNAIGPSTLGGVKENTATSSVSSKENNREIDASKVDNKLVDDAIKKANASLDGLSSSLSFSRDDKSGKTITKLIDKESGETIRQFPSKEMIEIARSLGEAKNGIFISEKV